VEPFLSDAKDAGKLIGVSRSLFLQLDSNGRLGPESVSLGNGTKRQCRRWNTEELKQWADAGCPSRQEWRKRKEARDCSLT